MTLSELIREYRAEHDISMAEFAQRCGVSKAYVGFLEKGENPRTHQPIAPSIQTLRNLAQGMHMDFNTLVRTVNTEVIVNASEETLNSQLESQTKANTDSLPDNAAAVLDSVRDAFGDKPAEALDRFTRFNEAGQNKLLDEMRDMSELSRYTEKEDAESRLA